MASIHKDPRGKSPFWYCAYSLPNGRRAFKSTKLTDRNAAMEMCLKLAGASKTAARHGFTEDHARKLLDEIAQLAGGQALRFRSVADYCREWISSKETGNTDSTATRYRGIVESFLAFVGRTRAQQNITTVTAREIKAFRDNEVAEGKAKTSANLALKTLRSVFNEARREGLISTNPAEAIKTFDAQKEERDVFTHDQLSALLRMAAPEWKTMILLAYYTGARLKDCAGMAWQNISFQRKELRFFPKKTSHGIKRKPDWKKHVAGQLEIPLMSELETHLLSLPSSDDPDAKVCPKLAAKGTGGNQGLSMMFRGEMAKAGILAGEGAEKTGKGRRFKTLGFHSLRHSFVSELANADVPGEVRQKISGHNSEEVHERYTHLDTETKRRAMEKMRPLGS